MACFKPLSAWQSKTLNPKTGKTFISFQAPRYKSKGMEFVQLPCGRCIGCRLERSRQWAIRCLHEAQLHEENCFITLTFSEEYLDPKNSLNKADFQKFMKRLRKYYAPKKIRFMHAGEYGEITKRPHHHALLFGVDFSDKKYHATRNGHKVFTSKTLQKIWPFGLSEIGDVTFESAAYVARYCCKKQEEQELKLPRLCSRIDGKTKEYNTMSRRPGIAQGWLDKYGDSDVWNSDNVVVRGIKMKPPKFYTQKYELTNPEECAILKEERKKKAADNPNNRWERLTAREKCQTERFKQLKRSL